MSSTGVPLVVMLSSPPSTNRISSSSSSSSSGDAPTTGGRLHPAPAIYSFAGFAAALFGLLANFYSLTNFSIPVQSYACASYSSRSSVSFAFFAISITSYVFWSQYEVRPLITAFVAVSLF